MDPSEPDDWVLLDAWRSGDEGHGARLFHRHVEAITRFFSNKHDRDVEDLVQDTFLGLLKGTDGFRRDASVRTILFVIARRRLYDRLSRTREQPVDFDEVSVTDLGVSPSGAVAARQEHRRLLHALRTIPLDQQILLELAYWEDLDGPALAEVLGIPANTVRSRLSRARDRLAEALAQLAESPEQLASTLDDLAAWTARVRSAAGYDAESS
jgi:RNA polymerase sigma-70 factor (ECF subfamily)